MPEDLHEILCDAIRVCYARAAVLLCALLSVYCDIRGFKLLVPTPANITVEDPAYSGDCL